MGKPNVYFFMLFIGILSSLMAACTDEKEFIGEIEHEDMIFSLEFPTRASAEGSSSGLDPLTNYFEKEKSILLIEQRTTEHSINFNDNNVNEKNKYLYKYVWDGVEAQPEESGEIPNWQAGFNFKTQEEWNNPLVWKTVKDNGAFNASYAFGALYYPVENKIRTSIETDQNTPDGLGKSNILGTYHRTQALYERFRFRLFHLMACIRVNLLVPESRIDEINGLTGYDERIVTAKLLNLQKDFHIEWGTSSSDEPPVLKADESSSSLKTDINMYAHPVDNTREVIEVDLSYFGDKGTDNVRVYTFSGLFPAQTLSNIDNILQFDIMDRNGEEIETNYYWSSSKLISNLQISQGTITNLVLYLPRIGNEVILVTSNIIDWDCSDTSLTLTPED